MKESHPVETAEFARARDMDVKPASAWWVPYTLRKRDIILSKIKARIRKMKHKYAGIEIPLNIDHAMQLDKDNGNSLWRDALALEMTNIGIAFEVLVEGKPESESQSYELTSCASCMSCRVVVCWFGSTVIDINRHEWGHVWNPGS
jgi:hypothetical protein